MFHTLTADEQKVVAFVERSVLYNNVIRTDEIDQIAADTGIERSEVAKMIPDLVRRGYLKCATESWGNSCWITVPYAALPPHLTYCDPFGL